MDYLAAYDNQLRTDAETPGASGEARLGPLRLVRFGGSRGFITYRDLGGADEAAIAALVEQALAHYRDDPAVEQAGELVERLGRRDGMELWVAEANGEIVSAGRLEPVAGTDFAGLWGGSTRPEWRLRGIYRALTAVRARSALRLGKTLINSDSSEYSRPILERSGFVKVSTTTPYVWRRA